MTTSETSCQNRLLITINGAYEGLRLSLCSDTSQNSPIDFDLQEDRRFIGGSARLPYDTAVDAYSLYPNVDISRKATSGHVAKLAIHSHEKTRRNTHAHQHQNGDLLRRRHAELACRSVDNQEVSLWPATIRKHPAANAARTQHMRNGTYASKSHDPHDDIWTRGINAAPVWIGAVSVGLMSKTHASSEASAGVV